MEGLESCFFLLPAPESFLCCLLLLLMHLMSLSLLLYLWDKTIANTPGFCPYSSYAKPSLMSLKPPSGSCYTALWWPGKMLLTFPVLRRNSIVCSPQYSVKCTRQTTPISSWQPPLRPTTALLVLNRVDSHNRVLVTSLYLRSVCFKEGHPVARPFLQGTRKRPYPGEWRCRRG